MNVTPHSSPASLARTNRFIRTSVLLAIVGMLMLIPVLLTISGLAVGLFMLGSALLTVAIVLYVVGVVRDLRRREAL